MNTNRRAWEHPHLSALRVELERDVALCERTLVALGEPAPEPDSVLIRTDIESVDLALARALALVASGVLAKVDLTYEYA